MTKKDLVLTVAILILGIPALQAKKKDKNSVEVILEMSDGSSVRGWNQTPLVNNIKFIEISDEPKGKRVRYDNDQVVRMKFPVGAITETGIALDTVIYVQKDVLAGWLNKKEKTAWFRQDYVADGIGLYSFYSEHYEQVNNTRRFVSSTTYYIRLGDEPLQAVATKYYTGGAINQGWANRVQIARFFEKSGYTELANRVKEKEFDTKETPIDIIKAWVDMYGKKTAQ